MSSLRTTIAGLGLLFAGAAAPAEGQFAFGLAGGATIPSGSLNDRQNLGYNALATLQLGVPAFPLQFRADLQYNSFGGSSFSNAFSQAVAGSDARVISGSINGVFTVLPGPVQPYLIGGVGYYDTRIGGSSSTRRAGFNYGGGVKVGLLGTSLFVEGRVHQVRNGAFDVAHSRTTGRFIPVNIGIMF